MKISHENYSLGYFRRSSRRSKKALWKTERLPWGSLSQGYKRLPSPCYTWMKARDSLRSEDVTASYTCFIISGNFWKWEPEMKGAKTGYKVGNSKARVQDDWQPSWAGTSLVLAHHILSKQAPPDHSVGTGIQVSKSNPCSPAPTASWEVRTQVSSVWSLLGVHTPCFDPGLWPSRWVSSKASVLHPKGIKWSVNISGVLFISQVGWLHMPCHAMSVEVKG